MKDRTKKIIRIILALSAAFVFYHIFFQIAGRLFPLPRFRLEQDYASRWYASDGTLLHISLSPGQKYRFHTPLQSIPEDFKKFLIASEDRFFYCHPGVNPVSLFKAFFNNLKKRRIVSGASTITMQVIKMTEPAPRTYLTKIREIFRAFQLEYAYSKNEIFSIYLSTLPMGGNVEGIGAGAWYYFGKRPSDCSVSELAVLAAIPSRPASRRPDRFPQKNFIRKNRILHFARRGGWKYPDFKEALKFRYSGEVSVNRYLTPHLLQRLKKNHYTGDHDLSVDLNIQDKAVLVIEQYKEQLFHHKIFNAAAVVLENETGYVRAYVGNIGYFSNREAGKIDCAAIYRSPGSVLKPFIYMRGISKGFITPHKVLYDIPRTYDTYHPENYLQSFSGRVTAKKALLRSLNSPAVHLESLLKADGLSYVLEKTIFHTGSAIKSIQRRKKLYHAGLASALGAFPVSVFETAALYRTLASGGSWQSPRFFKDTNQTDGAGHSDLASEYQESKMKSVNVFHEGACYIVSRMLEENPRTDLPRAWEFTPSRGPAAMKTGTSFGLKDAWCAVYNKKYTVVVWTGNASCKSSSFLTGRRAAAPIAYDILNRISGRWGGWFKKPDTVKTRKVCRVSGMIPGPCCTNTVADLYIPGVSSSKTCEVHKMYVINSNTSFSYCPVCRAFLKKTKGVSGFVNQCFTVYPSDYRHFLYTKNKFIESVPSHDPGCPDFGRGKVPDIVSPGNGVVYTLINGLDFKEQKVKLLASTEPDSSKLTWYYNSRKLATVNDYKPLYIFFEPGTHVLSVTDSFGRRSSVKFHVKRSQLRNETNF